MPGNVKRIIDASVADPGCFSRIPDPDFVFPRSRISDPGSRIPDPKTATKERGEKNCCLTFFVATKNKKSKIVLILNWCIKYLGQFTKKYRTFYPKKIVIKLSKIWVWDPGSGIQDPGSGKNLFWILDPGSRVQKGTATQKDGDKSLNVRG
jgi:hypothetical protein